MATWKKVLTEEDGNLASTDLTATSITRSFKLGDGSAILSFKSYAGNDILSLVNVGSVMTSTLSGGMQIIQDASGQQGCLKLFEGNSASNYVCLMANSSATANQNLFFPPALPSANQVLEVQSVSGSDVNLAWADAGGGVTIDNYADTRLLTAGSSSSNIDAESNLTFDGLTLDILGHIEYTADANTRSGEFYDAGELGRYETTANITAGDIHEWKKTGSVTAFKIYTLNGQTQLPELLNASVQSTNINQIAGICPITSTNNKFYVRCMATIPASSVNGTYSNSAGDPVYLDPSNAGELTLTEPTSGAFVRQMGYILSQTSISSTTYYVIWFDPSPNYIRV